MHPAERGTNTRRAVGDLAPSRDVPLYAPSPVRPPSGALFSVILATTRSIRSPRATTSSTRPVSKEFPPSSTSSCTHSMRCPFQDSTTEPRSAPRRAQRRPSRRCHRVQRPQDIQVHTKWERTLNRAPAIGSEVALQSVPAECTGPEPGQVRTRVSWPRNRRATRLPDTPSGTNRQRFSPGSAANAACGRPHRASGRSECSPRRAVHAPEPTEYRTTCRRRATASAHSHQEAHIHAPTE